MGCQSSLLQSEGSRLQNSQNQQANKHDLNIDFSDFVKSNTGHVYEIYHLKEWINKSNNAIVRWAEHREAKTEKVIKIIKRTKQTDTKIMNEILTLKSLDHPNIVKLDEYFLDNQFAYLVLQPIRGKKIYQEMLQIQEDNARQINVIMKQVLQGIQYCHARGIAHLNLIPQNILICEQDKKLYIKIVGFGSAKHFPSIKIQQNDQDKQMFADSFACVNNVHFMNKLKKKNISPEIAGKVPEKYDIWCCGIIMSKILSRILGIEDFTIYEQDYIQQLIKQKSDFPEEALKCLDLIQKMLEADPAKRWTSNECLNHEVFQNSKKSSPWKITFIYRSMHQFSKSAKNIKYKKASQNKNNQLLTTLISMYITLKQASAKDQHQFLTEFYNLDQNKDGMLQYHQLLEGMMNFYKLQQVQARSFVDQIFQSLDSNHNRCIQYSEFLLGTLNIGKLLQKRTVKSLFDQFDINKDGFIDKEQILKFIGKEKLKIEDDNKISFAEFQKMINEYIKETGQKNKLEMKLKQ